MTALAERIDGQFNRAVDPAVSAFAGHLAEQVGAIAALFYGSNLRTGVLEGVLDFYLLVPGSQIEKIWPRVSYHEWLYNGVILRAKVATMSLATFRQAAAGELRDTTIWARFVQPSAMVWQHSEAAREDAAQAIALAAMTAARFAAALGPKCGPEEAYWRALFQETYKAEFRVEKAGREDSILSLNRAHFDRLLQSAWTAAGIEYQQDGDTITPLLTAKQKATIRREWKQKRRWGKPLNIIRLFKASTTFDGAARYAAWKIERHTGVPVEITPWREKHPVLAAPGVLWRVWRAKQRNTPSQ